MEVSKRKINKYNKNLKMCFRHGINSLTLLNISKSLKLKLERLRKIEGRNLLICKECLSWILKMLSSDHSAMKLEFLHLIKDSLSNYQNQIEYKTQENAQQRKTRYL